MKEKIKLIFLIIIIIALFFGCGVVVYNYIRAQKEEVSHPVATFEIQDVGNVKIELYPEYAPNTVTNFIKLIQTGFYNNKVVYGKDDVCLYMARSAEEDSEGPKLSLIDESVEADSDNDYEYEIDGEFIANNFEQNTLRHEKGVISLNRSDYSSYGLTDESYNSGSYRFSVLMADSSELNGVYCAFGKVIEGMDILENLYNTAEIAQDESEEETAEEDPSIQAFATMPVITNATVETNGVDYGNPVVHEAFDVNSYLSDLYSKYYSN